MAGYLDAPPSSRAKSGLWATRVRQFLRSDMEKSLSARVKAVSMLHPPISVGTRELRLEPREVAERLSLIHI